MYCVLTSSLGQKICAVAKNAAHTWRINLCCLGGMLSLWGFLPMQVLSLRALESCPDLAWSIAPVRGISSLQLTSPVPHPQPFQEQVSSTRKTVVEGWLCVWPISERISLAWPYEGWTGVPSWITVADRFLTRFSMLSSVLTMGKERKKEDGEFI